MKFLYWIVFIFLFIGYYFSANYFVNNKTFSSFDNYINYVFFSNKKIDYKNYNLKNIVIIWIDDKFLKNTNKTPYNIDSYEYIQMIKKIWWYNTKIIVIPDILNINFLKTNLWIENNTIKKINIGNIKSLFKLNIKNKLLLWYDNYNYSLKQILEKKWLNFWYIWLDKKTWIFDKMNNYQINWKVQIPLSHKLYYFLSQKNVDDYDYFIKNNKLIIKDKNLNISFREIPLEKNKSIISPLINIKNIEYISLYDLYKNKNIFLKDKIVFFWYNLENDRKYLSYMWFKNKIWYVLNNYLALKNDIFYKNIDKKYLHYMFLIPLIMMIIILMYKKYIFATLINSIFIIFYIYLYYLLNNSWIILNIWTLIIILLVLLIIILILWAFNWYIKRKYIHNMFDKYVWEEVLQKKEESKTSNISQKKEIFILFTDIASFTSISEKIWKSSDIINMLNIYFKYMNEAIEKNNWFIDKYVWDAIIAFWENEEYADNILKHIIYMKKIHKKINNEIKEKIDNEIELKTRFWLHYWEAILWDVWDNNSKLSYTAIWDNINLASRLEWINKYYWTNIIISETVIERIKNRSNFIIRLLDNIKVKWKNKWIKIYELIWYNEWNNYEDVEYYRKYEKWIYYYLNWNFTNALSILIDLKNTDLWKKDKTLSLMYDRILSLKNNPPENWDGVWVFNTK